MIGPGSMHRALPGEQGEPPGIALLCEYTDKPLNILLNSNCFNTDPISISHHFLQNILPAFLISETWLL